MNAGWPATTTLLGVGVAILVVVSTAGADDPLPDTVEFNRHIRPILSDHCYVCHGPDSGSRKVGLRLDRREDAVAERDGGAAIVPGDPESSLLIKRVRSHDPAVQMPPPEANKPLTDRQRALLARWIEGGAAWERHWSFIPPERFEVPSGSDHPIDAFVRRALDATSLAPAARADQATLLRRVTYDLTGLPPTVDQLDAFLADSRPGVYERAVDRLLADASFGEHKARYWLDAARYADTHGLHLDNERTMWKYRDWVIEAMNRNMPFDQFTIEQLAGDLLDAPTIDQLVASGFNRCHVTTSEGGAIDAEYLVKYAIDRVETSSTVWLGLTAGCAQCHDHKFDPITQDEFYRLYALFNNTTEAAMDGNAMAPPPVIRVPTPLDEARLDAFSARLAALDRSFANPPESVDAEQAAWESKLTSDLAGIWSVPEQSATGRNGTEFTILEDGSLLAGGPSPDREVYEVSFTTDGDDVTALGLDVLLHESHAHGGPGRWHDNGNFVLSEVEADVRSVVDSAQSATVTFVKAWADHSQDDYPISRAIDGSLDEQTGWASLGGGHPAPRRAVFAPSELIGFPGGTEWTVRLHFVSVHRQHTFGRIRFAVSRDPRVRPVETGPWEVAGPYSAESSAVAFNTPFAPETDEEVTWTALDAPDGTVKTLGSEANTARYVRRTITAAADRDVELAIGSDDGVRIWINEALVHSNQVARGAAPGQDRVTARLRAGENVVLMKIVNGGGPTGFAFEIDREELGPAPAAIARILERPAAERVDADRAVLTTHFRGNFWEAGRELQTQITQVTAARDAFEAELPTTLISRERDDRRMAYFLDRGAYDRPKHQVSPDVPAVLPALSPRGSEADRLDFARWLVDPDHPLTARVAVNRIWQEYFGQGLVVTAENFGSQGNLPTHPELLDWLALQFIDSGWDVKALHRLIVTSETYKQSSRITAPLRRFDPDNALLARGPRFRLDAEMIRDGALAMSGLLVDRIGGPSVKPYQPAGLWEAVGYTRSNTANFTRDTGEKLYRRSVYTFWKRTSPPPVMTTFDAPNRETCSVRRERTNTPLGALALMNETGFVEAARHMAERMMACEGDHADRLAFGFRIVTSRAPDADELALLVAFFEEQRDEYRSDVEAARLLLSIGESGRDETLSEADHAAYTMAANLLLNLDEAITKG